MDSQQVRSVAGGSPDPAVLHSVSEDLSRLDQILIDAIERLTAIFGSIQSMAGERHAHDIEQAAFEAVMALQFQDMSSQLIAHCRKKLSHPNSESAVPFSATHFTSTQIMRHMGPVSQTHVGEGSIDLF